MKSGMRKGFLIGLGVALQIGVAQGAERYHCTTINHPVDFFTSFDLLLVPQPGDARALVEHVVPSAETGYQSGGYGSGGVDANYNPIKHKDSLRFILKMQGSWCPEIGGCDWRLIAQSALLDGGYKLENGNMGGFVIVDEGSYAYDRFICEAE